jgi:dethiobiotin synthetase
MGGKREQKSTSPAAGKSSNLPAPGLLVLGSEPGCGKTVVTAGLAAVLKEEGFQARAIKPVLIGDRRLSQSELQFLSTVSHSPLNYAASFLDNAGSLSKLGWTESLRICRAGTESTLVELPGSCATPLSGAQGRWTDNADFACELKWPCLVVARAGHDAMEKLLLNTIYLQSRGLKVIALVTAETSSEFFPTERGAGWEIPEIALQERTGAPFIGCLKHSPSISVPRVSQGNVIKTTSACLDLLPVIKALNLRISV